MLVCLPQDHPKLRPLHRPKGPLEDKRIHSPPFQRLDSVALGIPSMKKQDVMEFINKQKTSPCKKQDVMGHLAKDKYLHDKSIEEVSIKIEEEKLRSENLKWRKKIRKRDGRLVWGTEAIKLENYPVMVTKVFEMRCRHNGGSKPNKPNKLVPKAKRQRRRFKPLLLCTDCPCLIKLSEYKLYYEYQCCLQGNESEQRFLMESLKNNIKAAKFQLVTIIERVEEAHNHPLNYREDSVVTSENHQNSEHTRTSTCIFRPDRPWVTTAEKDIKPVTKDKARSLNAEKIRNILKKDEEAGWDRNVPDMTRLIEELRIEDPGGYYIIRSGDGDHGNSMLILQTSFMCQMQRKYVKNLCVYCDSTHKVAVNENVSLYVLALKTNTGFQTIAIAFTINEEVETVQDYLEKNIRINPKWKLLSSSTDYCNGGVRAFERAFGCMQHKDRGEVFSGVKHRSCLLRIARAIQEWIKEET
ncbi:uncharacterized protein LOC134818863 [Bolinopsis microptera]|uniref:uncharacterized protein LOC134818863 n=1 Tax=Bolinopsis microptera TaxID=2820187 RepID=UPI003079AEF9